MSEGDLSVPCKVCHALVPQSKLPEHYTWHLQIDALKWQQR